MVIPDNVDWEEYPKKDDVEGLILEYEKAIKLAIEALDDMIIIIKHFGGYPSEQEAKLLASEIDRMVGDLEQLRRKYHDTLWEDFYGRWLSS